MFPVARSAISGIAVSVVSGCTLLFPGPAAIPVDPEVDEPTFRVAWTAEDSLMVEEGDMDGPPLPIFSRVDVIARTDSGFVVRCAACGEAVEGVLAGDHLIWEAGYPQPASYGDLAEFALAVRAAAERRDLPTLRSVMASDFTYSFVGPQTRDAAIQVWRSEDFAALAAVPDLLDEGLGTTDGRIWAAPRAYRTDLVYRGYRLGFRRNEVGRWEWLYLIRGITP